jgi:hypothetical protein
MLSIRPLRLARALLVAAGAAALVLAATPLAGSASAAGPGTVATDGGAISHG